MSRWIAAHLSWFVCALLALWAPPLLFTMGVDLGVITEAQSGFPALTDVAVITTAIQLILMAAALPGLAARQPRSWQLLSGALAAWCAHAAWMTQARIRLVGFSSLGSRESLLAIGGITVAALALAVARSQFEERRSVAAPGREHSPVATTGV
jgi:hypothetical protein